MATPAKKLQNDKGTQETVYFLWGGGAGGIWGGTESIKDMAL